MNTFRNLDGGGSFARPVLTKDSTTQKTLVKMIFEPTFPRFQRN